MILVDSSIWIDHLARGNSALRALLNSGKVLTHPFVIGELACGKLSNRREILDYLHQLPEVSTATDSEVLGFIENYNLMGRGIGYVDAHLLASVLLSNPVNLWTRDRRLATVAADLSVAH